MSRRRIPLKPCRACGGRKQRGARRHLCNDCRRIPTDERHRIAVGRYYETLRADPKRWAAFLEQKRLESRLRLERQGRPARPISPERYPGPFLRWRIEPAPLVKAMRRWLMATGESGPVLARRADVSFRLIEAHLCGERNTISVDAADRIATSIGLHLDVIYQDDAGVTAAVARTGRAAA